jgi:methionyl-tRNA formyltransferase
MARILFMGTPEYARIILEGMVALDRDEIRVVTKPDAPSGRMRRLTPSPVAGWASGHGLCVDKPVRLKDFAEAWKAFDPDWIVTAAYGRILPSWLLALPKYGAYNFHASVLPRWRGPNPIAWAIRAQDPVTGVTLMEMDRGIDTGPIVKTAALVIGPRETLESLSEKLARLAVQVWKDAVCATPSGKFDAVPQPDVGATYAPKFVPDAGRIDWRASADQIDAVIRSVTPEPRAYTYWQAMRINIVEARVGDDADRELPGVARLDGEAWTVGTGSGTLVVTKIQPEGRRPMTPGAFVRGRDGQPQRVVLS